MTSSSDFRKKLLDELQYELNWMSLSKLLAPLWPLLPEEPEEYLCSYGLGADGPYISSLFLVTPHLLSELHVAPSVVTIGAFGEYPKAGSFDFMRRSQIITIRFTLEGGPSTPHAPIADRYERAQITLVHGLPEYSSVLTYVGHKREEWLTKVMRVFPLSRLYE